MISSITATGEINYPLIDIEELKRAGKIYRENAGASIIDIGDNIALVEFHTKANSISGDICEILTTAVQEGANYFDALVIGNRGKHFSAGANLMLLLELTRASKWKEIEQIIRQLQDANMALKYGSIPVVAAPFSSTLGGGCEICLHSHKVVAAEELHMGLVETGVGLIPGGGGTKERALRALISIADKSQADLPVALQKVFEEIFIAKVSRNGTEAKQLFLSENDMVVLSKVSPIEIAKQAAIELARSHKSNDAPKTAIPVFGKMGIGVFQSTINHMLDSKAISEHDAVIAQHIAKILCGGDVPSGSASEQHFLDLERESFLSLLGTEKTQERIEFLLKNNKPLRN